MSDIVDRLRAQNPNLEAAREIEMLRSEIEKLRGATSCQHEWNLPGLDYSSRFCVKCNQRQIAKWVDVRDH